MTARTIPLSARPISKAAKEVYRQGRATGRRSPHDFDHCRARWLRRHQHEVSVRYLPEWEEGFRAGSMEGTAI